VRPQLHERVAHHRHREDGPAHPLLAPLDPLPELDLLRRGQERDPADLAEIPTQKVPRARLVLVRRWSGLLIDLAGGLRRRDSLGV